MISTHPPGPSIGLNTQWVEMPTSLLFLRVWYVPSQNCLKKKKVLLLSKMSTQKTFYNTIIPNH